MIGKSFFDYLFPWDLLIPVLLSALWSFILTYQTFGMLKKSDVERKGLVLISWLLLNAIISIPVAGLALVGHTFYPLSFNSEQLEFLLMLSSWIVIPPFIFFVMFFALQRTGLFKRFYAGLWSKLACIGTSFSWTMLFSFLYVIAIID